MIQSVHITNPSGDTLDLTLYGNDLGSPSGDDRLLIFNLEGLGPPNATVSGAGGPTYDGVRGSFVRTDSRQLQLTLVLPRRGDYEETARRDIYKHFPVKEAVTFRVVTDTKDVVTEAVVEEIQMNHFSTTTNAVISLTCPYPYWTDMVFASQWAEWKDSTVETVVYAGKSIGCSITIIFGQESGTELLVENDNGSQAMTIDFVPTPISATSVGSRIYINTVPGQRSVIYEAPGFGTQTDLSAGVTGDWIQLRTGDNNITVTHDALGGTSADMPDKSKLVLYHPLNSPDIAPPLFDPSSPEISNKNNNFNLVQYGSPGLADGKVYPKARDFVRSSSDYYLVHGASTAEILNPVTTFAFCVWFRPRELVNYRTILNVRDDPDDGFTLQQGTTGQLQFIFESQGSPRWAATGSGGVGTWMMASCHYNDVTDTHSIYKNTLVNGGHNSPTAPDTYMSSWVIGSNWEGQIGPLMFWNGITLTQNNRNFLYNSGKGRTYAEVTGTTEIIVEHQPLYQGV